ncbi:MFS transporter [Arthrobacter sp. StoSoilB3]|uniref:MHS family metabolite:H+ symporter-like MFS transporter n=1 Tax=Paenarthrobacter nicotinovorans TaxID=29320 RepID=A0ABT9TJE5_PAENI|nr:MFS transporter [Paenarthrobacter nicotinovorans]KIA72903.1 major facilitator transporter [Arthrobacter sp. MWB30]SKB85740.1 MFS transporter, MHS family, metabolite:H+ symporter [Arthrobacter sp. 31Cvi3.1E]BCW11064.1 MFS transporter [Arthrobacter sp. NtRootA2]BCW15147.1 MFS transporter [Arthrobacter sp. NtRootA4]BCW23482.1 MFS transporter [Arthrobacter sp. NtRootC7]BCW27750.1 MFS transporter [Arthrobacter sp. NtRootC45]BCW32018.1 MFS transporter [Arthrobacter sp. NtRootD5]BCW40906.1 MFS 
MTTRTKTNFAAEADEAVVEPEQLRRATLASSVGSALEYYDFYIYGLASALIFGPLFFSPLGPDGALIASFATYGVGFAARPFGGLIFGYIGDRFGRKMVLILTIALMGTASFAIGLLPTFEQAGMLGAVLLVTLRIIQGLGAGAEQAGATTLISEVAPRRRRGFFASLPFVGIQLGTLLGAGTFALITMADKSVLQGWLWRVPFLASFILIVIAIFIRLKLKETPAFQELEKHKNVVKNPIGALWKHSKKNVLIGIGLRMGENGNSSIYSALLVSFMSMPAGVFAGNNSIGPVGLLIAAGFAAVMVVTFGALSDRYGRVPVYRYGALFQAIIAVPAFYLVTLGNVTLVWVVMAVGIAIGVQSMLGPQCPLLPELFGSQYRFTGVAMSREISAVLAGGLAPLLGALMLAATNHSWLVLAIYSLVLALISFVTTFFTPETAGRDLVSTEDAK